MHACMEMDAGLVCTGEGAVQTAGQNTVNVT